MEFFRFCCGKNEESDNDDTSPLLNERADESPLPASSRMETMVYVVERRVNPTVGIVPHIDWRDAQRMDPLPKLHRFSWEGYQAERRTLLGGVTRAPGRDYLSFPAATTRRLIIEESTPDAGTGRISLRPPATRIWPPDLDYISYLTWLDAEKAVNERKGTADIGWRTKAMDLMLERKLNGQYDMWAGQLRWDKTVDEDGRQFLDCLREELRMDKEEITRDIQRLNAKRTHGGDGFYATYHELQLTVSNLEREAGLANDMAEREAEEEDEERSQNSYRLYY